VTNSSSTRLLVLSDLHAHTGAPDPGGARSLSFHGSGEGVAKLFDGLLKSLSAAGISDINAVICAGDLADRCDSTALTQIWQRLCKLADDLGAVLISTAGNHDHARSGGDPKQHLIALDPPFPVRDSAHSANYFAYGWARLAMQGHTVICVNSAAMTGYQNSGGEDEYKHGRVTQQMVGGIQKSLREHPSIGTRLLVVHHHPVQLPQIDLNEKSRIIDAELLLHALEDDGSWLVIHGHKHRPWIQYGPGGGGSPVLFSAGSFAAALDGVLAQSTKNQFYVIDLLPDSEAQSLGLGPAGTFAAWTHSPLEPDGWIPSGLNDGLPAGGGFGWRADPSRLAQMLSEHVQTVGHDLSWSDLLKWEPRLMYLSPDDWSKIDRHFARGGSLVRSRRDAEGRLNRLEFQRLAP
jgi:predicted phosphodiesterase